MDKEEIYNRLDNDESLTDKERRDSYFSEINNQENYDDYRGY